MAQGQHVPASSARPGLDYNLAPAVVFWETTRACALKCLHCRAEAQPQRHPLELSTEEGCHRVIDEVCRFGPASTLILTGGDPFMRRDLFDLVAYATAQGVHTALSPSATKLVKPESLARLKQAGVARISFSLDGSSPAVHDTFRGVSGSFLHTLTRMEATLGEGIPLQANTTVSRHNLSDLPALAALLASRFPGLVLWDVFFLVPTGRGKALDLLSPQEHEATWSWLYQQSKGLPFPLKTTLGQPYRRVWVQQAVRDGMPLEQAWAQSLRGSSNDGKGVCFISHLGEVQPSGFLPISAGNVRGESLVEMYRNAPLFKALRDPERLGGKCGRCEFRAICGGCRARAYGVSGDYLAQEPCCPYQPVGSLEAALA
ncbi:MAG: TIGR04053 family radical SAM/SPASM domain-containing protein [Chloroflexi bacterium]|nr:TIGR04053 family radical SAM/SPASM domain-containing protein [Chloroflexota bacterium]